MMELTGFTLPKDGAGGPWGTLIFIADRLSMCDEYDDWTLLFHNCRVLMVQSRVVYIYGYVITMIQ